MVRHRARKLGDNTVIGIGLNGDKGEELWNYALIEGLQPQLVEPIVAGQVTSSGAGQWLLPGPDGSINIVDIDGKLVDQAYYGALGGLAAVEIDGKPAIIVASADGVEALGVK